MNSQGAADDDAAERFVEAALEILHAITGSTGQHAQRMAREMVAALEGLEHSTESQVARTVGGLEQLQAEVESAKQALDDCGAMVGECLAEARAARASVRDAADAGSCALAAVVGLEKHAQEEHARRVREMEQRNEDFERRLRQEHSEFARMHARRLAKAMEGQARSWQAPLT
ncbi:hypothetical protein LPJ61_002727 [Coemansia biformis]|uniref:Uncharacterized protein n=1 Tax=Coemansia biformis TaxID=1286918 RepID=A0A9W8CYX0_9FUNG|nr:hypothetical protein LPJ61_002727 [Coemansia biformis]